MSTARDRGWGDPTSRSYRADHIIGVQAGGVVLYVRREVAHLFMGFLQEIVHRGYPLHVRADDWGHICRPIRGYEDEWERTHDFRYLSNHSWGLAIDINATTNPMTTDGRVHTDMPAWVEAVAAKWGLAWGGAYSGSRKDPMHFEFVGTPADVRRYPLYNAAASEDDMTPEQDARQQRIEEKLDKLLNAQAGYATTADGKRDTTKRSLLGRIGDHLKVTR